MRDYLSILVPLLREGSTTYRGRYLSVDGGASVPGTKPVSVVVGALAPLMIRAAGELADGVVTWLAGPRSLESVIVPTLTDAAAGRPAPRVVAAIPVAVCDDEAVGREAVARIFARYDGLENYRRLYAKDAVSSVAELAVVGDEKAVADRLQQYADVGVSELWAVPFPVGDASTKRTHELLAGLTVSGSQ